MEQGELVKMVEAAYRQIHTEFTPADVANKVLAMCPDVDRDDLDAAVKAFLDFHDVDFEWNELLRRADVLHVALDKLRARVIAALRHGDENGDYEEAYKLKAEFEAKYAVSARLHAEIERMFEEKKEENRRITELFEAHPECKTLGDLKRKLAS
jgi:acyl-CoA reductase-like NAD-dependent aldehyde dehydrogenase